jgi:hypothetical protein
MPKGLARAHASQECQITPFGPLLKSKTHSGTEKARAANHEGALGLLNRTKQAAVEFRFISP